MGFIQNKINEIRRKPEYIRIRYAWACAASVTFLVIIIWIVSLTAKNEADEITNQEIFTPEQLEPIDNLKTEGTNLKNATEKLKDSINSQGQQKIIDKQEAGEGFNNQ